MLFVCHPKILHCLQFLLGVKKAPRETENNAYAKFWGDKRGVLWYVMVFSGVINKSSYSYIIFSLTFHKFAHKILFLCQKMIKKFSHTTKKLNVGRVMII